jgi:hypothetical protein
VPREKPKGADHFGWMAFEMLADEEGYGQATPDWAPWWEVFARGFVQCIIENRETKGVTPGQFNVMFPIGSAGVFHHTSEMHGNCDGQLCRRVVTVSPAWTKDADNRVVQVEYPNGTRVYAPIQNMEMIPDPVTLE